MELLFRVTSVEVPDVLAGLRAQDFDAAEVSDQMVGRGRRAVVVSDINNGDEAAEAGSAVTLLDRTAGRLPTP